ncbi:MAG: asparagine synthase C-terminal domain-containing protein [Gammaproteobacteria bacterium]|nr:asparagine synthase C-terminal domain-containing protein [Gammaproteobacteria bacterium]
MTLPLAEQFLSFPEAFLISDKGETKSIFRAAMRGIVPDKVLNRKDKVGFQTPEKEWLLNMAHELHQWLQAADIIPFINQGALIKKFDSVVAGKIPFDWQVWRWVNYVRWYDITVNH